MAANFTKTSVPGSGSDADVDLKHGSETQSVPAMEGNKTKKYGIAYSHRDDRCLCPY